ncbi:hypothetical protein QFC19_008929 [Naganishia cerealis]|uniref:Uncharacterized protein n=1 Tax=Naganishia cerealis TaxID=610337 RepID=A0ACC2UYP7_9TREE|nr:hypothetical protein QFC19_008929 [Naganishia cerealis]
MLTNHYLDYTTTIFGIQVFLSDKSNIGTTNNAAGYGSIGQGIANCVNLWKRNPNFILLDWYDSNGNTPFNVVAALNGVAAPTNTVVTSEFSKSSNSNSSSSSQAGTGTATGTSSTSRTSSSSLSGARHTFGGAGVPSVVGTLGVALAALAGGMLWITV